MSLRSRVPSTLRSYCKVASVRSTMILRSPQTAVARQKGTSPSTASSSRVYQPQLIHAREKGKPQRTKESLSSKDPPPLLLLEGDPYCISTDGFAHTTYHINDSMSSHLSIEESYDIEHSKKVFRLKDSSCAIPSRTEIAIDEKQGGMEGSGGSTGFTTWEGSIAMALYLASRNNLLQGNVLELGSGVGLGGILSMVSAAASQHRQASAMKTFTMTDYSPQVLQVCSNNVIRNASFLGNSIYKVEHLHWNEELPAKHRQRYDTIIACDCVYRPRDIPVLHNLMHKLLSRSSDSRVHLFGPSNRAALMELVATLEATPHVTVTLDTINMSRTRERIVEQATEHVHSCGSSFLHASVEYNARFHSSNRQLDSV